MSSGGIFDASGMCCGQETSIPTGRNWEATITSRIGRESFGSFLLERRKRIRAAFRSRGAAVLALRYRQGCGSEDAHPVVLAFPGASVLGADSATEQERECCSGRAFCMRESKSRPRGGFGLGALGARCSIYIFTVMGSVNLKLRVDSAGSTISLLPV